MRALALRSFSADSHASNSSVRSIVYIADSIRSDTVDQEEKRSDAEPVVHDEASLRVAPEEQTLI